MLLPEISVVFFIATERDGRTLLFDNAIWSKRSAWPGDWEEIERSEGKEGREE